MKSFWDLFEGLQINSVLRERLALMEQKFKDLEGENKKLKEQVVALSSEASALRSQISTSAPTQPPPSAIPIISDDADALCILQSWWGHRDANLNTQAVEFEAVDRELNLAPGTAKTLLEKAVQKYNYVVDRKGVNYIVFRKDHSEGATMSWSNPGWEDDHNPFRRRR